MATSLDGKAGESKNCSCASFLCSSLPDDVLVDILCRVTDRKHLIRLKSIVVKLGPDRRVEPGPRLTR
jgi:hypothetical protein